MLWGRGVAGRGVCSPAYEESHLNRDSDFRYFIYLFLFCFCFFFSMATFIDVCSNETSILNALHRHRQY